MEETNKQTTEEEIEQALIDLGQRIGTLEGAGLLNVVSFSCPTINVSLQSNELGMDALIDRGFKVRERLQGNNKKQKGGKYIN